MVVRMGEVLLDPSCITRFKEGRRLMNEKKNKKKKMKKKNPKNKDEPTSCTHFAAHSALWHFCHRREKVFLLRTPSALQTIAKMTGRSFNKIQFLDL